MKFLIFIFLGTLFSSDALALRYQWKASLEGTITRCFDSTIVRAHCEDFSETKEKPIQELLIDVSDGRKTVYAYGYLKAIEGPLCQEHLRTIRRLMKNVDQVCITGWGESLVDGELLAHWSGLETKRGEVQW